MKTVINSLQVAVNKITHVHFAYIALYMATLVAFDSWNLVSHEGVVWRWQAASTLLIVTAICWYLSRTKFSSQLPHKLVVLALVLSDIVFAALNVYWQRGMSSKAVALFAIPIVVSAVLRSRRAVLATATFSAAVYSFTAVRYFHLHYGEGFKVELYGEVALYSGVFFILTALLLLIIKPQNSEKQLKTS